VTRIEISDFSADGFTAMINYIYSGDQTIVTQMKDLEKLFEVYNFGDKYFLSELKELAKSTMLSLPFSSDNYAAVFRTVAKYENMVHTEALCQDLTLKCATAVRKSWKTVNDCTHFWSADLNDDITIKVALFQKISTVPSRNFRSQSAWIVVEKLCPAICKVGLDVSACVDLKCLENEIIPAGSMGKVHEYIRTISPEFYNSSLDPIEEINDALNPVEDAWVTTLSIQWDDLPEPRTHSEGDMGNIWHIKPM